MQTCNENSESLPSLSGSESDEVPRRKTSKRRSSRLHSKRRNKDVRQHLSFSKYFKDNCNTSSETEAKDDKQSAHKQHIHYRRERHSLTESDSPADSIERSRRHCHKRPTGNPLSQKRHLGGIVLQDTLPRR